MLRAEMIPVQIAEALKLAGKWVVNNYTDVEQTASVLSGSNQAAKKGSVTNDKHSHLSPTPFSSLFLFARLFRFYGLLLS